MHKLEFSLTHPTPWGRGGLLSPQLSFAVENSRNMIYLSDYFRVNLRGPQNPTLLLGA